jgi:hypothetical protein
MTGHCRFTENLVSVHVCFNICLALGNTISLWFLNTSSVYPLLTSQVHQEPCNALTIACLSLSVAEKDFRRVERVAGYPRNQTLNVCTEASIQRFQVLGSGWSESSFTV